MKHIVKGAEPRELRDWINNQPMENGQRINIDYNDMPKGSVKRRLLEDQGWLCCYTGIQVNEARSHIEHIKPRAMCDRYEKVDYANLLAAYPGDDKPNCGFGAKAKENWHDPDHFINPLRKQCETCFHFDMDGGITPVDGAQLEAARHTIKHLKLAHSALIQMRRDAIEEVLFPRDKPISEAKLRVIAEGAYSQRNNEGRFPHLCFVIEQVARLLLHKVERDRKRREAIHKQSRR
jgi:uncharacterized protein (TIGR02646 family)